MKITNSNTVFFFFFFFLYIFIYFSNHTILNKKKKLINNQKETYLQEKMKLKKMHNLINYMFNFQNNNKVKR